MLFGAVAGPAYVFDSPSGARRALVGGGAAVFVVRVVSVLARFQGAAGAAGSPDRTAAPDPDDEGQG